MPVTLYGIPNCDTVKKAREWLKARDLAFAFHDYKKSGADAALLNHLCAMLGWEKVLNRAGTTFRKLPEADREGIDQAKAVALMAANPSCIKRPILDYPGGYLLGFKEAEWASALS